MSRTWTGLLKGRTVWLDAPVPSFEGKRVRVVLEALERELEDSSGILLTPEEQAELGAHWVEHGPQGPINDDEPNFHD